MRRTFGTTMVALWLVSLAITSSPAVEQPTPSPGDFVSITLSNHSVVSGKLVAATNEQIQIKTAQGLEILPKTAVVSMKVLNEDPLAAGTEAVPTGVLITPQKPELEDEAVDAAKNDLPGKAMPPQAEKLRPSAQADPKEVGRERGVPDKLAEAPKAAAQVLTPKALQERLRKLEHDLKNITLWIETGNLTTATECLRAIVVRGDADAIEQADKLMRTRFHRPLGQALTLGYLGEKCKNKDCKARGVLACSDCGGVGYVNRVIERNNSVSVAPGTHKIDGMTAGFTGDPTLVKMYVRDQLCFKCRGHGYDVCQHCFATQKHFIEPTPYERSDYADALLVLANKALKENETAYGGTYREDPPNYKPRDEARLAPQLQQVWLRDSANKVKSDILRLWRAKQYYEWAMKADPALIFRSSETDYREEVVKIDYRLKNLYGELFNRQEVFISNRTEHRLDELNYYEHFGKSMNGGSTTGRDPFKEIIGDR